MLAIQFLKRRRVTTVTPAAINPTDSSNASIKLTNNLVRNVTEFSVYFADW